MTRPGRQRARDGFTLLELLIVMIIIVIAAFAVRPTFGKAIEGNQERTALRQLVGFFQLARTQSVAKGRLVRLTFEPMEATFAAEVQTEPDRDPTVFDPMRLLGRSGIQLPDSLSVSRLAIGGQEVSARDRADIYFYPDGRTDGVSMLLADDYGREVLVEVSSATGRVRFRE